MALIVSVFVTVIGPVYTVEAVVGALPSVVKNICAFGEESVIVTCTDGLKFPPAGFITGAAACVWPFSSPKTFTWYAAPRYTFPLVIVGTANFTLPPGLSRAAFCPLEYNKFATLLASNA